ncbi:MAG: hypothetical protein ACXWP0_13630 [Ktedonobacterales bacterium]
MAIVMAPSESYPMYERVAVVGKRIDRYVARQLADEDLVLLAYVRDSEGAYLVQQSCFVNVSGRALRTYPLAYNFASDESGYPDAVWWGKVQRFNRDDYLKHIHEWEQEEVVRAPLRFSHLARLTKERGAVVFSTITEQGSRFVILPTEQIELMVWHIRDLRDCTIDLLENKQVRITYLDDVLGAVMPLVMSNRTAREKGVTDRVLWTPENCDESFPRAARTAN